MRTAGLGRRFFSNCLAAMNIAHVLGRILADMFGLESALRAALTYQRKRKCEQQKYDDDSNDDPNDGVHDQLQTFCDVRC